MGCRGCTKIIDENFGIFWLKTCVLECLIEFLKIDRMLSDPGIKFSEGFLRNEVNCQILGLRGKGA